MKVRVPVYVSFGDGDALMIHVSGSVSMEPSQLAELFRAPQQAFLNEVEWTPPTFRPMHTELSAPGFVPAATEYKQPGGSDAEG